MSIFWDVIQSFLKELLGHYIIMQTQKKRRKKNRDS